MKFSKHLSSANVDALALAVAGVAVWWLAVEVDAYEAFHDFLMANEGYELDEILLALIVAGIAGFLFGLRRLKERKQELLLRREAQARADWLSTHDPLTALPNRRYLSTLKVQGLKGTLGTSHLAFLAIDLDGFKRINDLIGHAGGDELLKVTAERLSSQYPNGVVIRLGGDEFLVIVDAEEFGRASGMAAAKGLITTLCEPLTISDVQVEVGASVGIAIFPDNGEDIAELLHAADVALYFAKRSGRNTAAFFELSMHQDVAKRAELESRVRTALQDKSIAPFYQPIVDLKSNKIVGAEVLARWSANDGATLPPDVFIPVAEEIGGVVALSEQLLSKAATDALDWPEDVILSFNIAPTMLSDRLLGKRIQRILVETGFPASRLEVEFTEGALLRETEAATTVINDLVSGGVRIALDDFGTGYSNILQLSELSFSTIKIDRKFVDRAVRDETQQAIVQTMIDLATRLGVTTIAEGVETAEQRDAVLNLGCEFGQGYYFSRAVPSHKICQLFEPTETRLPPELAATQLVEAARQAK